jgi:hypothetical protein
MFARSTIDRIDDLRLEARFWRLEAGGKETGGKEAGDRE